ncbi:Integral membrane protein [Lasiodiplodia theobromae]|uniref:Integral membrane protein n=1 Tax=Lasiodiplodia theobromae TaxID=45133 RepID=UPI0015C3179E|nr:Integral membrane protein [Lasiodiplodia theobromae]KAF4537196.1 Integral membrane protein [Lasiodiplodia theobromae]
MLAADIQQALTDGRIPNGISTEYLAASKDSGAEAGILAVLALALIITALRLYARISDPRGLVLEDYLIILTAAQLITFVGLCLKLLALGSGRHIEYIEYVLPLSTVNTTEVLDFTAHIIYTTALYTCRMSGLSFYRRLCLRHGVLSLAVNISFGLITAGFVPQLFLIIFHCTPVTGLWPYPWQPEYASGRYHCIDWGIVYLTNSIVSLVSDLILFVIPIALIAIYRGSIKNKIKLSVVLIPGILVIAISITRLDLVHRGWTDQDQSWSYGPMLAIETAEIGGTMVALSAPALKVFFGRVYHASTFHSSSKDRATGRRTNDCGYGAGVPGARARDAGTELEGWQRRGVVGNETVVGASAEELDGEDGRGSEEDLLVVGVGVGSKDGGLKVSTTVKMRT